MVNAADTLTLTSGDDTTLRGAQATGHTVRAAIGGNLDLASEQDTNDYASHSLQAGLTLIYGWSNGGVGVSGNLSASQAKANDASVTQLSGIGAGHGGFDLAVGGHTNLTGAVIASTAAPTANRLTTGSLSYSNLENVAKSSAESLSVGGGSGGGGLSGLSGFSGGPGVPQHRDQHSTTQAGLAPGTIVVGNNTNPNLAGLDRNPSLDNADGLTDRFNPQQVAEDQQAGLLAGQVGMTAAGDLASAAGWKPGSAQSVTTHAIVGAATAALGSGNILQGAEGAGLGEAALPYLAHDGTGGVLAGTTLVGALVGGGAGASTALAGTEYNYLSHPQRQQEQQQLAACGNDAACQQNVTTYWNQISASQSLNMTASLAPGSYTVDLADANPYAPGYDTLLATAIAQAVSHGALNPATGQLDTSLVNEADGEPAMQAYNARAAQAQQQTAQAIGSILLIGSGPALVDENPDSAWLDDIIANEAASSKATTLVIDSPSNGVSSLGQSVPNAGAVDTATGATPTTAPGTAMQTYYPPNGGFWSTPTAETLQPGSQFSRYGGFFDANGNFQDFGGFGAPADVPYGMRALPPDSDMKPLSVYEVLQPMPNVLTGQASPYYGEIGFGQQYQFPMTIQDYLAGC